MRPFLVLVWNYYANLSTGIGRTIIIPSYTLDHEISTTKILQEFDFVMFIIQVEVKPFVAGEHAVIS